ncbi:rhodanese-like domain-containing protein [Psychromonas sp. Urea-02u-13]|uniref:rhodanese-like domain-containing protein n=1 Tax=Psychromonas sp. Urea-02u-13 TaxID=2058326 RepID=UPI000C3325AB|nr:rhodanese-like domain-containing protein [Psychromonas sp. Urea-02u-13]PKG38288.1 sulfurtransferase [Psychromonas sp. Urea-02u-13]
MLNNSNAFNYPAAPTQQANDFFTTKLACETDCSDVYADIKENTQNYILLDVRSQEAFDKSHAISAVSMPHSEINSDSFAKYSKDTLFVVYCWGPGCNGATKAGLKISTLGFAVKEMIGGIHYWEDFERYPVNRRITEVQI